MDKVPISSGFLRLPMVVRFEESQGHRVITCQLAACGYGSSLVFSLLFMSNTARFNRIAKARGSAATRARSSRIRGPAHGCQGLASSQRRFGGNSTQIIRSADLHNLNQKGELALLQAQVEATPDIIIQQTYGADSHNFDMPMGCDYADSRPLAEDNSDSDWEEENEIENEAEMLILQMKRITGHENCCKDYWTCRD